MSDMIATKVDGTDAMAYVGDTPWHGKGSKLTQDSSIEVWAKESGLDFELATSSIQYATNTKQLETFNQKNVIYRKDNNHALGIVSNRYKIVQPIEVLEFFRDLVGTVADLETAGVLRDGAQYWALARMNGEFDVSGDVIRQYLLLASSADGSLATQARLTSVRVVCNNTLQLAQKGKAEVTVRHSTEFDASHVKKQLANYNDAFKAFEQTAKILASAKLSSKTAMKVFTHILGGDEQTPSKNASRALALFEGAGIGAEQESTKRTAWGALNAVTQLVDWELTRSADSRLKNAWFGNGSIIKQNAANELLELVA